MFLYHHSKLIKLIKFKYFSCSTIFTLHSQTNISKMLHINVTISSIAITNYALKEKRNI